MTRRGMGNKLLLARGVWAFHAGFADGCDFIQQGHHASVKFFYFPAVACQLVVSFCYVGASQIRVAEHPFADFKGRNHRPVKVFDDFKLEIIQYLGCLRKHFKVADLSAFVPSSA